MSVRSFSARVIAASTLLFAAASPALADKLKVTGPGFSFSGPCDAVERPWYLSCERFCAEINKIPGYSCTYSEGRVVIQGGGVTLGSPTDEAALLDLQPFSSVDLDLTQDDGGAPLGEAPAAWHIRAGVGIEVYVRDADGLEEVLVGPVDFALPTDAGTHVQIVSHTPFHQLVSLSAE